MQTDTHMNNEIEEDPRKHGWTVNSKTEASAGRIAQDTQTQVEDIQKTAGGAFASPNKDQSSFTNSGIAVHPTPRLYSLGGSSNLQVHVLARGWTPKFHFLWGGGFRDPI